MPSDLACNSKLLAYDFAVSLQPERDAAGLAVIALGTWRAVKYIALLCSVYCTEDSMFT